jgi:FMN phosphatase YigB (HAD superfamily)
MANFVRRACADIVSVDFFDTAVYRRVECPADVFRLQHANSVLRGVLPRMCFKDWVSLRKSVEADLAAGSHSGEPHIDLIYDEIGRRLGLAPAATALLRNSELATEDNLIEPYRDVLEELGKLAEEGFRIVFTTDTYLPAEFIRSLLTKWAGFQFELFCSSATGMTKRSGAAFTLLADRFPGSKIVHFGDNFISDVVRARGSRVTGKLTYWNRQAWLERERPWLDYRRATGAAELVTPLDGNVAEPNDPMSTLAWRWSTILADFVLELRRYAEETGATDIWFLSRDCESIFAAIGDLPDLFAGFDCRYVYASRAAWHPALARVDPVRCSTWIGRPVQPEDIDAGDRAARYLNGLLTPNSRKVLIVDVGWKGRLQVTLRAALAPEIAICGHYIALDQDAARSTLRHSRSFVEWDQSVCHQEVIERVMGFAGDRCIGYEDAANRLPVPVLHQEPGDVAPASYCEALRFYLALQLRTQCGYPNTSHPSSLRRKMLRQICHLPDRITLAAFSHWPVGSGSYAVGVLATRASWSRRVRGMENENNPWAVGGLYYLLQSNILKQAMIYMFFFRERLKVAFKRATRHRTRPIDDLPTKFPADA